MAVCKYIYNSIPILYHVIACSHTGHKSKERQRMCQVAKWESCFFGIYLCNTALGSSSSTQLLQLPYSSLFMKQQHSIPVYLSWHCLGSTVEVGDPPLQVPCSNCLKCSSSSSIFDPSEGFLLLHKRPIGLAIGYITMAP